MSTADLKHPGPVVCIGETMAMAVASGAVEPGSDCRLDLAGAESNVARSLIRLGTPAAWVSAVGEDPFGAMIVRCLSGEGIDTSAVRVDPRRPTGFVLKVVSPGERDVHYYRSGSAASVLDVDDARRAQQHFPNTAAVVVSGITPALGTGPRHLVEAIVHKHLFPEALVVFDVNHRPVLWPDGDEASATLAAVAGAADVVLVGRDEAAALWPSTRGAIDALRQLLPGPAHLVIKDGPRPAVEDGPDGRFQCQPDPITIVDSVGAGDAFAAGWLAAYLRGMDTERRLDIANRLAAATLRSRNDVGEAPPELVAEIGAGSSRSDRRNDVGDTAGPQGAE